MNIQKNGADILLETLQSYGEVDTIFGYPGGASIPLYNSFAHSDIKHILSRHEQGAAFMAQGYSRSTGKLGVVDATSGPGVANTFTAIADAYKDHIGMLLISGQVVSPMIGRNAFQELETTSVFQKVTKYFKQIRDVKEIIPEIQKAIDVAMSGCPGPVHLDIPKDIFLSPHTPAITKTVYKSPKLPEIPKEDIQECLHLLQLAQRPILLVGQGVKFSGAEQELLQFVERFGIPMIETALGKGIIPFDHSNNLGMLGMHGFYHANMAVSSADLIINIGSRFDDRIVGNYDDFGRDAKIIHIDIDEQELGRHVQTDVAIHGDASNFLQEILVRDDINSLKIDGWKEKIQNWKNGKPYEIEPGVFGGKQVLQKIQDTVGKMPEETIYGVDVGQHQMWASQILQIDNPNNWLFSGGFGTMGFSLPSSIGAAIANPDKRVISISGDGGIQMNIQELGMLIQKESNTLKDLDIKIIILDNEYLGMVKQWQDLFPENTRSEVDVQSPDFDILAQAYGIPAYKISDTSSMNEVLPTILQEKGPALIWCTIEKEENVFPMVPAGKRLDEMVFG